MSYYFSFLNKNSIKAHVYVFEIPNQILYSQKNKQFFLQICDLTLFLFTQ